MPNTLNKYIKEYKWSHFILRSSSRYEKNIN